MCLLCRREFVENVSSAVELLNRQSFAKPLCHCPRVAGHFQRILDKRSQLLVEDKLETVLNECSTTMR